HAALQRERVDREEFLALACGKDEALRHEVMTLLHAHVEAGGFGDTPVFASALRLEAGSLVGPYRIDRVPGVGGMGEVYRARDRKLDRDVAIKILPDALAADPDRIARFEREAKTLAALNHAHIAQIHGLEESGSVRALVMELVEGEDLSQRIARGAIP